MLRKYTTFVSIVIFLLAGCTYESNEILWVCPGKKAVTESISAVKTDSQKIFPFKAHGRCYLRYFDEEKSHSRSESMSVKLRVFPPVNIYLQADAPLVSKAVVLGSNEEEFWVSIRPKEVSVYWWGKWSEQDNSSGIFINPKILLEAFGIIQIDEEENWSLTNEGPFDILTKQQQDSVTKKIYVYSCDYLVRKIEYFDPNGDVMARVAMGKYKKVSKDCLIPSFIEITTNFRSDTKETDSIALNLWSIRPATINKALFKPPKSPRGYKHIYQIVNGQWIEEPQ